MVTKRDINKLDHKFENLISNAQKNVKIELTPEKRKERREKADNDDLAFCKIYFPDIFDAPWTDVHYHIAGLEQGVYTVSGARLIGKSAVAYFAKIVKPLCLDVGGIINLTLRTQEHAGRRTKMLSRLIQNNQLLMYDYDIRVVQDAAGYHVFGNTTLVGTGVKEGLRSFVSDDFKRFKISINDDLYNKISAKSEKDNEKVTDFVQSEIEGQMEDDGLCITLGNSINHDCPIVRLKKANPENHFSQPALDEDGNSTYPERFSNEYWEQKKSDKPYDIWMGEYMDQPLIVGDVFNPDMLNTINVNTIRIVASITAADPSYGQSPSACWKSLATLGRTNKKKTVMLDIFLRKCGYITFFDYVDNLRSRIPAWKILAFENDFNQWSHAKPYYDKWREMRGKHLPIMRHNAKELKTEHYAADKESRIMNLVYPHEMNELLYDETITGTKDFEKYKAQLMSFGETDDKLDGPDATATAFILLPGYTSDNKFESTKKKRYSPKKIFKGLFS